MRKFQVARPAERGLTMERLTYRDTNGELWYSDNGTERDRLHRLAAYEDSGLTPEEIQQMLAKEAAHD